MALNPDYNQVAEKLHDALLALSPTKADAATHIITTGGLSLPQAGVEKAIDFIIEDQAGELIIPDATYAALLAKHQASPPDTALRVLMASTLIIIATYERDVNVALIAAATAEWNGLSQPQKDAIPAIKEVADAGIVELTKVGVDLQTAIDNLTKKRTVL